jgi:hypothetical protein
MAIKSSYFIDKSGRETISILKFLLRHSDHPDDGETWANPEVAYRMNGALKLAQQARKVLEHLV